MAEKTIFLKHVKSLAGVGLKTFVSFSLLNVVGMDFAGGCASFGHSCFGGHGKRSEVPPVGSESLHPLLTIDPADYQALDVFRQFCSLSPEQYLRLAPVFRKLVATITAEEEPLPRK